MPTLKRDGPLGGQPGGSGQGWKAATGPRFSGRRRSTGATERRVVEAGAKRLDISHWQGWPLGSTAVRSHSPSMLFSGLGSDRNGLGERS